MERYPALPFRAERDAGLAGGACWIPEGENHRFAIGQPTLGNLENLVGNGRCLIEQVERC